MILRVTITVPPSREKDSAFIRQELSRELKKQDKTIDLKNTESVCEKKSIDARHGKAKLVMRFAIYTDGDSPQKENALPVWKTADKNHTVIIVGSGPAGLFGALTLLEHGIRPVIVEQGSEVGKRKRDIAEISTKGNVNDHSNYCFGEGGAGTFSDGKLYTRSNKRGDISKVLRIFVHFGADKKILTDAHPHIGTDKLPDIIKAMRGFIISRGGNIYFDRQCIDFIVKKNSDEIQCVCGIKTKDTNTGHEEILLGDAVLLATGHSAEDMYYLVAKYAPLSLEAKTFAVGVRVEHPREVIDSIQYKNQKDRELLGAAEYRFTSQQAGRGVYSFCMCPGGFVVPSASRSSQIVVNGMSAARRNSAWSNAAFVVETKPEDIPLEFVEKAKEKGSASLAGLLWREHLEEEAYRNGMGQKAPAQKLTDFLNHRDSSVLPPTSFAPGVRASRLDKWLPPQIAERLEKAFYEADRKMKGFASEEALLIAIETRTSTPVRILRELDTCQCSLLKNLYPAGEGSGYAGGIVSSAMDGIKACEAIATRIEK